MLSGPSLCLFLFCLSLAGNLNLAGPGGGFGGAGVDAFFFDKFERLKRLPSLASLFPGFNALQGVRVCINFNSVNNYQQPGYQQNTCFVCDSNRFTQIASYCTGQTQIPSSINYTQANCIMNSCQPAGGGTSSSGYGIQQQQQQQMPILTNRYQSLNYP